MEKVVLASSLNCCCCGKPAVAFWPVLDPDIPSDPYCRKCLDKAKFKMLIRLQNLTEGNMGVKDLTAKKPKNNYTLKYKKNE